MKHAILPTSALLMLVWLHLPTEARSPLNPLTGLRPDYSQVIIPNESSAWTARAIQIPKHKALIRNTRNRQNYYASIGEFAGEAIVEKIEPRRVTLNQDGTATVYRLPQL